MALDGTPMDVGDWGSVRRDNDTLEAPPMADTWDPIIEVWALYIFVYLSLCDVFMTGMWSWSCTSQPLWNIFGIRVACVV